MPNADLTSLPRLRTVSTGILGQLNAEWAVLNLHDHRETVAEWVGSYPVLAPARSLGDIVRIVHDRTGHNDDEVAALIDLTQQGDSLANQTLTQILIGPACRLASRTRAYADDLESARCQAIGSMWVAIHTYRLSTRTRNHVSGLTLDALRVITRRPRAMDEIPVGLSDELGEEPRGPDLETPRGRFWARTQGTESVADEGELGQLLYWARSRELVTETNSMILWRMHGPRRSTSAQIAGELGLSPSAIRERARSAVRSLAGAVRDDAGFLERQQPGQIGA